jgi:hypothetical protein
MRVLAEQLPQMEQLQGASLYEHIVSLRKSSQSPMSEDALGAGDQTAAKNLWKRDTAAFVEKRSQHHHRLKRRTPCLPDLKMTSHALNMKRSTTKNEKSKRQTWARGAN